MAFTGAHVVFGYAGSRGVRVVGDTSPQSLFRMVSSETLASAGTTTITAPVVSSSLGEPIARVSVAADSFVAFGATPNASTGTRDFIPAGETRDYVVSAGEKMAWVTA